VPGRLAAPPRLLTAVRHSITHRRITIHPVVMALAPRAAAAVEGRWVEPASPTVPTSSIFSKIIRVNNLQSDDAGE
jgi:hypothetical protein